MVYLFGDSMQFYNSVLRSVKLSNCRGLHVKFLQNTGRMAVIVRNFKIKTSVMKKVLLFSIILIIFSCKSKNINDDKYLIENLAAIANAERISEIYPDANPTEGIDSFEEGTVQQAYNILYPETDNEA